MDGPGPFLASLRAALAAFDDDALAALANRGLVRRARKDLETNTPRVLDDDAGAGRVRVAVEEAEVELMLPPVRSRCSCPASGVCRHILTALIFVKERAAEGEAESTAETETRSASIDEVLALDDESISRWAGKPLVTRVRKLLAQGLPVEFEPGGTLAARLPTRNVTCRWMPGGGPEGMVCSCHAAGPCEHRVAAVLAFQAARGVRVLDDPADPALTVSAGAPRTRDEVLASVGLVVAEMVTLGLARLSRGTAERLRTLAISAHGVDLPRLERMVRSLAAEAELYLARDAQAESARLLGLAARVEALRVGLTRNPSPHLIGLHRTTYEPVGDIEVVGLGARAWRSGSGFAGLTVYFWDRSARDWATWTDARPLTVGGFDPVSRSQAEGPWSGISSPAEAARRILRLTGCWRNREGRLSGRPSTQAITMGAAEPASIPARIEHWDAVADKARALFGGGFRDRSEQDAIVLLSPASWGAARFNDVRQELVRLVFDPEGRPLSLVLRHLKETDQAVTTLKDHDPADTRSVLGILHLEAGQLAVEPIALHTAGGVINLTLDGAPAAPVHAAGAPVLEPDSVQEDDEAEVELEPSGSNLGRLLGLIEARLLAIAEGGPASFRGISDLRALAARAEAIGLAAAGKSVGRVVETLEAQRKGELADSNEVGNAMLLAYHVLRLSRIQEAVATATLTIDTRKATSSPPQGEPALRADEG
jgi:hypothetical protein